MAGAADNDGESLMPWNPWSTFASGNFWPESSEGDDSLSVAVTGAMFDAGAGRDTNNSFPVYIERSVGFDALVASMYTTYIRSDGSVWWEDDGPYHLEVHFTTVAARDAYMQDMIDATTPAAKAAVVQLYRDNAVGGYWGTVGVAL